ncbi:MAG: hypothetical protein LRZ88_10535 [Candidatus Cloacimonetes bacterium]|nr:hypothetical protein [Candidatus Cloacimonadota bacterium]
MLLVVFDDKQHKSFYPIAQTRSVGDLRCGILKLRQRLEYIFADGDSGLVIEDRLVDLYRERHPDWNVNNPPAGDKLYINSRLIISDEAITAIKALTPNQALLKHETILALRTSEYLNWGFQLPSGTERIQSTLPMYEHIAQLIHDNGRMITWDFEHIFYDEDNFFETEPGVSVLHPYNVWIAEGVDLAPNVVLDASEGPIVIDEGAKVMAGAVLCGPLYVGKKSLIKIAAKIYGSTSIGPVCKVGGEVEGSIFQAYSNKQHDGFLGHAYIGEWVKSGC